MDEAQESLGDILARIGRHVDWTRPVEDPPCGALPWKLLDPGTRPDSVERCDGIVHHAGGAVVRPCPLRIEGKIRERVEAERERLLGALSRLEGEANFASYDAVRHPAAAKALDAMRRFSAVRDPARGVLLSGETGLGKTHLLLVSHFARLSRGWPSEYVMVGDLRPLFRDATSFNEDRADGARGQVDVYRRAPVLHVDDLGDVRGSDAFHAGFAAGFKALLDAMKGKLAVALNLGSAAAREHPDIGDRVLSRLRHGAEVVRMEGEDQRVSVRGAS